jgi:uncharacterized protein (TIGR00255 family)
MIRSMTGFGRAEAELEGRRITAEIRSVNHRFREINCRLPKNLASLEPRVLELVQGRIQRGKIHVVLTLDGSEEEQISDLVLNEPLARRYLELARELQAKLGVAGEIRLNDLLQLSDILLRVPQEMDEEGAWPRIREVVEAALDDLETMRAREGESLARDLLHRAEILEQSVARIEARLPVWLAEGKKRLEERIQSLTQDVDFNRYRLEAEIVLFTDRFDCTEECVRLRSHIQQLRQWIEDVNPTGRKLNFLLQEMNREANTIGSKAQDVVISREVVLLKEEIEKIREQVQNIE